MSEAGITNNDRFGYFSVIYGKSNLTPLSHRLNRRKIESVPLGNGQGLAKAQYHAPVVTEWVGPSSADVADGMTTDQREAIRGVVNGSTYKPAPQSKEWVGIAVAYALGMDIDDEGQKKRVNVITKALFAEGFLIKTEEHDPVQRRMMSFVRVT